MSATWFCHSRTNITCRDTHTHRGRKFSNLLISHGRIRMVRFGSRESKSAEVCVCVSICVCVCIFLCACVHLYAIVFLCVRPLCVYLHVSLVSFCLCVTCVERIKSCWWWNGFRPHSNHTICHFLLKETSRNNAASSNKDGELIAWPCYPRSLHQERPSPDGSTPERKVREIKSHVRKCRSPLGTVSFQLKPPQK